MGTWVAPMLSLRSSNARSRKCRINASQTRTTTNGMTQSARRLAMVLPAIAGVLNVAGTVLAMAGGLGGLMTFMSEQLHFLLLGSSLTLCRIAEWWHGMLAIRFSCV